VLRPLDLIPLHRSRHSQGRRPYEPSVRRDGGSVARGWIEAGRTVRETVGTLKRWGNSEVAIIYPTFALSYFTCAGSVCRQRIG